MSIFPPIGVNPIFNGWDNQAVSIGDDGYFLELAAQIQITNHIDEEIQRQETFWQQRMQNIQSLLPTQPLPLPKITPINHKNIFTGARPSLLQASIDFWPSVTVRCGDLKAAQFQEDEVDNYLCDFYVEIMTYAGPVAQPDLHSEPGILAEGQANLQAHLLSSAVLMCIKRDPTLGGAIPEIQSPPAIHPSFPTAVAGDSSERNGDYYLYQGRQFTFGITRRSV